MTKGNRALERITLALLSFATAATPVTAQDIHQLAAAGDTGAVSAVLADHPDLLEARDQRGLTPLDAAVLRGHAAMVNLLLDRGADIDDKSSSGAPPPVELAFLSESQRGGADITRLLLSRGASLDPNALVRGAARRLDMAVIFGNLDMVRLLVESGAHIDGRTPYRMKPLANAAVHGHTDIVRYLLSHGADPNAADRGGDPPLVGAIMRGHAPVVEALLDAGADPGFRGTRFGRSAMHLAALAGHADVVDRLLAGGADVTARDDLGRTPLYYALRYGHHAVADLLVERGAPREDIPVEATHTADYLRRPLEEGEAAAWYLNNRGWAVRTRGHFLVFDAEEFGVTRPGQPSLANGFLTPAEIGDFEVVALYTAYHGEIGEPAYVHQIEDSLRTVTYVHNAGDPWRGSEHTVYLSPRADTSVAGMEVATTEVTHTMTSLGYLVKVDGLVLYYAGFRAEDPDAFEKEMDFLAAHADRVDLAFLPIPTPDQAAPEFRRFLERFHPRAVALLDPDRRAYLFPQVAKQIAAWGSDARVFTAENPGDSFLLTKAWGGR